MIERKDLFSIPFYNKTQYTGSHLGLVAGSLLLYRYAG